MSSVRPIRQPAARVELPKAPSTGHPARRPSEEIEDLSMNLTAAAPAPVVAPTAVPEQAPFLLAAAPRPRVEETEEKRVNFGARVRASVRLRARLWSVQHEVELQDLLDEALDEYLTRRGG